MSATDDVYPLMRNAARELQYIGSHDDWKPTPEVRAHLRMLAHHIEGTVCALDFDPDALNKIGHGVTALTKRIANYRRSIKQLQKAFDMAQRSNERLLSDLRRTRDEANASNRRYARARMDLASLTGKTTIGYMLRESELQSRIAQLEALNLDLIERATVVSADPATSSLSPDPVSRDNAE